MIRSLITASAIFLTLILSNSTAPAQIIKGAAAKPRHEVRAVWLTTLSGLDWPSKPATTEEGARQLRQELCRILDKLQQAGINTVLFQSRIRSTTAYPSAIEPWDAAFTGTPGKAPLYDPLAFAIEECHKRHMELHAWVVAFPICKVAVEKRLGKQALPRKHPELCRRCGDQWMMDPGVPATGDYLARICEEIVRRYDVDGIHLDYIRYPEESIPWNDRDTYRKYGQGMAVSAWRRENVTSVVRKINHVVKDIRPWVKISCSPIGKHADLPRQSSYGWNARDAVHQDAQKWLREGLMDMLFPMMYFDGRHFYPFAQDWQEQSAGRPVVPGLGIYFLSPREKNWPLGTVARQMQFTRLTGMGGQAFFRSRFFTDNVKGLYDFASTDFYTRPALIPPMTWADSISPAPPHVKMERNGYEFQLTWQPVSDNTPGVPVTYNVYRLAHDTDTLTFDQSTLLAQGLKETTFRYAPLLPRTRNSRHAVTAVDAYGNESPLTATSNVVSLPSAAQNIPTTKDGYLSLPADTPEAPFYLVTDLAGRAVMTIPATQKPNLSSLMPGHYELRTLGKRGVSHRIMYFRKE